MFARPWSFLEGVVIILGLIVVGLLLQVTVGAIDWSLFAWPVNMVVLGVFLLLMVGCFLLRRRVYAVQFMATCQAAVPALVGAVVLTVIMGVTRQVASTSEAADPLGLTKMLSFWPFVLVYVWIAVILSQAILHRLCRSFRLSTIPFLLNHLGLLVVMLTATLGHADMQRLKMITAVGEPEWRALDEQGAIVELPLAVELHRFIMETHDDGSPRRFASDVQILTKSGKNITATIDVNKPVAVDGWDIYQYGYDQQAGAASRISIFELVSDPWLPAVYTGIFMMLFGALCMIPRVRRNSGLLAFSLVMAVALVGAVMFWHSMNSKPLMPALQSPWFAPHVIVYIFSYTVFGAAALIALFQFVRRRFLFAQTHRGASFTFLDSLVYVGLAFMTFGMLFGALWAKEAWGHYWSWDPKETWAAATWMSYLVYLHYRLRRLGSVSLALLLLILCFLLLQMCWWGINYLPSAQAASVHTYNM